MKQMILSGISTGLGVILVIGMMALGFATFIGAVAAAWAEPIQQALNALLGAG